MADYRRQAQAVSSGRMSRPRSVTDVIGRFKRLVLDATGALRYRRNLKEVELCSYGRDFSRE